MNTLLPYIFGGVLLAAGAGTTAQAQPTTRDAAYWPYAATSPWNLPIGSGARYAPVSSSLWTDQPGGIIQYSFILTTSSQNTMPVVVATATDPVRTIFRTNGDPQNARPEFTQRVPAAAQIDLSPGNTGDHWMQIIDETHRYVTEMFDATKRADGNWEAPFPNRIDLHGSGLSPDNATYIGSNAYGGSGIAGLIRTGEMTGGIRHALRMSLAPAVLNRNAPDGRPFVWPAVSADGGDGRTYSGTGNAYLGSLLAIPADVDLTRIPGVGAAGPVYELARALQDYGAYVVDRGYFNIYSDVAAGPEVQAGLGNATAWAAMKEIGKRLHVVTNNGPTAVGGGGTRRRPLAPPFASTVALATAHARPAAALVLWPNPARGLVHLEVPAGWRTLTVRDLTGKVCLQQAPAGPLAACEFDASPLRDGLYSVEVAPATALPYHGRLLVQH